ncbi:MAG: Gfo/Idh/MocA family oxidoreductase [Salinivirgaceae bacterium]|nr:Gfo/Idh/MocA family oxidoreductase [Salinivirgaceae bacterium]
MTIKWGILGAGWIADKFVADFKLVEKGEVIAVGARSKVRSEEFAKRFNITKAYGNYRDLVSDPDVAIIYIATTHNFHFEHAKLCLENGKHVLCEKPATVNAQEFEELEKLAKTKNLYYMEAMWTAFLPAINKTFEWINEGKIGNIEVIQASFGFPAAPEFSERLFSPHLAGGALLDIGIYPLTIIEMFAKSDIERLDINSKFASTGVDETLTIQIKYKNGVQGQMACSIKNRLKNNAFICGSKGFIEISDFWMSKKATLTIGDSVEVFNDKTDTMGYNCETEAVNSDLLARKKENSIMPLSRTKKMMMLMDEIRNKIGLKYPFE